MKDLKSLVNYVHLMFCKGNHPDNMEGLMSRNPDYCYFYLENTLSDSDAQEDHQYWFKFTIKLMEDFKTSEPNDCYKKLKELTLIISKLQEITPDINLTLKLLEKMI